MWKWSTDLFFSLAGLHRLILLVLLRPKSVIVEPCSWCECISSWLQASNLFIGKMKSIVISSEKSNTASFTMINIYIVGSGINDEFRTTEVDTFDVWTRTKISILFISEVVSTFRFFWIIRDLNGLSDSYTLGQLSKVRWDFPMVILPKDDHRKEAPLYTNPRTFTQSWSSPNFGKPTWVFNNFRFDQVYNFIFTTCHWFTLIQEPTGHIKLENAPLLKALNLLLSDRLTSDLE